MITSINLSPIPFQSNTDSTRLQMSSKQIQQSLTSMNCEIPYILGHNQHHIAGNATMGIHKAKDDGHVIFRNDELFIVQYKNLDKIDVKHVPPIKQVYSDFGSQLRNCLDMNQHFKKGDVLYEYDCFRNGLVSFGYNMFSAYMPWFGFNHEDGIVVSESFAKKAKHSFVEHVYVPINEFTLLQPLYEKNNEFTYFPAIGQQLKGDIICSHLIYKKNTKNQSIYNIKSDLINALQKMSLSQLASISNNQINTEFNVDHERSSVCDGFVSGIKIHKLQDKQLIDKRLQHQLDSMLQYYYRYLADTYTSLSTYFQHDFCRDIIHRYFLYKDKNKKRGKMNLMDTVYLLEFEISKTETKAEVGDKFTNLYAGKGVISQIIPDELRPISVNSNKPIDMVYNPFGVFSRMNYGQIIHGSISKTIDHFDEIIRNDETDDIKGLMNYLNTHIISYLDSSKDYTNKVQQELIDRLDDPKIKNNFVENVKNNNLYIYGKDFGEIDVNRLSQNLTRKPTEPVRIKKETLEYMRDKLKCTFDFTISDDMICQDIFCVPVYMTKLYKLTNKTMNARDFGPVESLTGQPTKGRAKQGGSKLGQMEINCSLLCIVIYI